MSLAAGLTVVTGSAEWVPLGPKGADWPCQRRQATMAASGLLSRASPVQTAVRNCRGDEGWPFGFGDQVADAKPPRQCAQDRSGGRGSLPILDIALDEETRQLTDFSCNAPPAHFCAVRTRARARGPRARRKLAADHDAWLVVENSTRFGLSFLMSGPRTPTPGVHDLRGQPYIATTALPWAIERAFRRR